MATTDMEQHLENLDSRLARVEQILPTLAEKADLERFATKADLKEGIEDAKNVARALNEGTHLAIHVMEGVDELVKKVDVIGTQLASPPLWIGKFEVTQAVVSVLSTRARLTGRNS